MAGLVLALSVVVLALSVVVLALAAGDRDRYLGITCGAPRDRLRAGARGHGAARDRGGAEVGPAAATSAWGGRMRARQSYSFPVSSENVAVVRAIFEGGASTSKEAMLAALPRVVPVLFHPDAEWIEAPERVDSRTYRGHDGIRQSFEHWLEQWEGYRVTAERFEDHGDQVLVVVHEFGEGHGSGASTEATLYAVFTFRDGKVSVYREFYDEATAQASINDAPERSA